RLRVRHARHRGLPARRPVHREDRLGADRPRRGRPQPHDRPRGTPAQADVKAGRRGGREESDGRRRETIIEIAEAVLLAVVAVATAWSGYQSALWDGHSAKLYGTRGG